MGLYLVGLMAIASVGLIAYAMWPKTGEKNDEAIRRRMRGRAGTAPSVSASAQQKAKESVAKRMMKSVTPIAMKPVMMSNPEEMSRLRMKLANAGYRGDNAPATLLGSKTIVAIGLALVVALYAWMKGQTLMGAAGYVLCGAAVGFMAPNLWLSMAISKRQDQIRKGLPDTLDLMVISVESGLGLDAAVQRVGEQMRRVHPAVAEEFQIVTLESQMGIPRSEALTNLTLRTGVEEVRSLVAIINQAERFGTSIARALRNQSDAMRVKRRQNAEERAQKTTVKLMAPLILFIFPAILVVLAGPAALSMIEALSNTPGLM
ncbi:MAG: type II secretion system F family protein [Phycisphaerales bacterium]|nr:MAG: type II secretion system F family protein [Phycisphaerales bacterium]